MQPKILIYQIEMINSNKQMNTYCLLLDKASPAAWAHLGKLWTKIYSITQLTRKVHYFERLQT